MRTSALSKAIGSFKWIFMFFSWMIIITFFIYYFASNIFPLVPIDSFCFYFCCFFIVPCLVLLCSMVYGLCLYNSTHLPFIRIFFYFSSFIFSKMLVKRHYDDSTFILWIVLMDFRLLSLKIQIHDKIGDIISHMLWYFSSLLFIFSLFFNSKEN